LLIVPGTLGIEEDVAMKMPSCLIPRVCLSFIALISPVSAADPNTPQDLAARIDRRLAARWEAAGVKPAARCDDAEFLRRIHLDLTGKIPPVAEVRRFLADRTADKRAVLVERLLNSPGYISHSAARWRRLLVAEIDSDGGRENALVALEKWLQQQFAGNVGLDRLARDLLTYSLDESRPGREDPAEPSPRMFYLGREEKPDELAAAATRLFLGVRLECAQCHDHPFARWKQHDFWSQAAFFTSLRRPAAATRELTIPGKERRVRARFLDGKPLPEGKGEARPLLVDWLTAADNPYFARAAVNRLWGQFFGVGLVDPVDDMNEENPASHPELLDELAQAFSASRFDLKFVIRAIVLSDAYQLGSVARRQPPPDPRLFSRMNVKSLGPEQLYDSLIEATGYRGREIARQRAQFLARFPHNDQLLEGQTGIPQALALMNGELLNAALRTNGDNTLSAVVNSPFLDADGRVETLFLAALGRPPRTEEKARMIAHVRKGDEAGALGDVFWALLNSAEFVHNH
jgi:Protein of unknown function (DUF1549)/Protein of unknown function (DUF1553)